MSFAEDLFEVKRDDIIEKYSMIGIIDPINLRSFLLTLANELDKAKSSELTKKIKVINLISEIVEQIEPFALEDSFSFRRDAHNITSPNVRFFQRLLVGNLPIKSFLPVQNEILLGASSDRIKNLLYRWADIIFSNDGEEFFRTALERVDLMFFNFDERVDFCRIFCQHWAQSAEELAQYPICGFATENSLSSGSFSTSNAFSLPKMNVKDACRKLLFLLFKHCIISPEHIPDYVAERLYLEAQTFDPMTVPRNNLFFVAANLGHIQAAREAGTILAVRENYNCEPTEEEKKRLMLAASYFCSSFDNISLWNIAFILEKNWLPEGKEQYIISKLEAKIMPEILKKQLPQSKVDMYYALCSQLSVPQLKAALLMHFDLAYIRGFAKSINSISNIVWNNKLQYKGKEYKDLCYELRQEAVAKGDFTAAKNISRSLEKEIQNNRSSFHPNEELEYERLHGLENKFFAGGKP